MNKVKIEIGYIEKLFRKETLIVFNDNDEEIFRQDVFEEEKEITDSGVLEVREPRTDDIAHHGKIIETLKNMKL